MWRWVLIRSKYILFCYNYRYAIGNAQRPMVKIGWLDILANDTQEHYFPNGTGGGPSIKVSRNNRTWFFCWSCLIVMNIFLVFSLWFHGCRWPYRLLHITQQLFFCLSALLNHFSNVSQRNSCSYSIPHKWTFSYFFCYTIQLYVMHNEIMFMFMFMCMFLTCVKTGILRKQSVVNLDFASRAKCPLEQICNENYAFVDYSISLIFRHRFEMLC